MTKSAARTARRDASRSAVYAAEELVFGETLYCEPLGASGVLDLARALSENGWWQANGIPFEVVPARRESQQSSASNQRRAGDAAKIRLSLHQEDAATLAHEAAHLLANAHGETAAHGPIFRAAEIDVVAVMCGSTASARLSRAFTDDRLAVADRSWHSPDRLSERGLYSQWRIARQMASADGLQRPTSVE